MLSFTLMFSWVQSFFRVKPILVSSSSPNLASSRISTQENGNTLLFIGLLVAGIGLEPMSARLMRPAIYQLIYPAKKTEGTFWSCTSDLLPLSGASTLLLSYDAKNPRNKQGYSHKFRKYIIAPYRDKSIAFYEKILEVSQ